MVEVKEMPYSEKYSITQDNIEFFKQFVPLYVRQELDEQAEMELLKLWQQGAVTIPDQASPQKRYELAYQNWMWMAKSDFEFIRYHLGQAGMERFIRAEVEALKRKNSSPSLWMLGLIRAISPELAFEIVGKQLVYELQWLTPYIVEELSRQRVVCDIPQCKILDYPDPEDVCQIGCQKIYPQWLGEQMKVDLRFERQDHHCTCTIEALL